MAKRYLFSGELVHSCTAGNASDPYILFRGSSHLTPSNSIHGIETMGNRTILTVVSLTLAICTNLALQRITEQNLKPVGEKCFAGDYDGLVPFEQWLGGSFVCIVTTMFHGLTTVPEGMFAWGGIMALYFPIAILVVVEATRTGVKGLLKYPIVIFVISQYIAVSVAFPLLWIPMYFLWGRGTTHGFASKHANFTDAAGLFFLFVSMAFFALNTQSYAWTWTASLIGGPFFPIPYVVALFLPSDSSDPDNSSNLIIKTYQAAALASFMLWVCAIFILVRNYDFDAASILGAVWTNTNYSVQIINLDWFVWFLSMVLVLAEESLMDGLLAIVMMPLVGPGASLALLLARQEQVRAKTLNVKTD
jgi:hypothetical protein